MFAKIAAGQLAYFWRTCGAYMQYAYQSLVAMLNSYKAQHGKPAVIALGKTHIEDLQNHFEAMPDGLYFEGVEVIQHNDPMGVLFARRKDEHEETA